MVEFRCLLVAMCASPPYPAEPDATAIWSASVGQSSGRHCEKAVGIGSSRSGVRLVCRGNVTRAITIVMPHATAIIEFSRSGLMRPASTMTLASDEPQGVATSRTAARFRVRWGTIPSSRSITIN